ncbi:hypothetical protein PR202_ga29923 [Eleusine coracana subsp. coracana]|uniref:Uncharacterized protein n=1 Tax=Eleusine coracana subsp. coracana TaxID=191504 RepID=A0AAV5DNB1_ELECO|nr:hypothetical protein PR202_ga29923 [Eleusine coracana subsp. coracana]
MHRNAPRGGALARQRRDGKRLGRGALASGWEAAPGRGPGSSDRKRLWMGRTPATGEERTGPAWPSPEKSGSIRDASA